MNKLIVMIITALSIISCKESKVIEIDNPKNNITEIEIDGKKIELQPLSLIKFELLSGEHSLKIKDNELTFDLPKEGEYILNPTKSEYIIEEILYGRDNWKFSINNTTKKINSARKSFNRAYDKIEDKLFMLNTIELSGLKLEGFYKKEKSLLIRNIWDYNTIQKAPNKIQIDGYGDKTDNPLMGELHLLKKKGKVKIFRYEDFLRKLTE